MTIIVDYDAGNPASIKNMLHRLGFESKISRNKEDILSAEKLILPGVGAFDYGMSKLHELDLHDALQHRVVVDKKPILGICLGFQLMTYGSEEGKQAGFGWIEADTVKFQLDTKVFKIPHMGWSEIDIAKNEKLANGLGEMEDLRYYFVHSYHLKMRDEQEVLFRCEYDKKFSCGVAKDNILGVQFHPEKSHRFGMQLLENFMKLY